MNQDLKYILEGVHTQLQFAESKNRALVVFNGAVLFGVLKLLEDEMSTSPAPFKAFVVTMVAVLIASSIISLLSFMPKLNNVFGAYKKPASPNHAFFGHLKTFDPHKPKALLDSMNINSQTELDHDLAHQIINNSRIAAYKFACFSIAVVLAAIAFAALLVALLLHFIA